MAFLRNGATGINHILSHSDVESILLSRGVPQETLNLGFKMLEKEMLTEKEFADVMRLWKDDITVTRGSACDEE